MNRFKEALRAFFHNVPVTSTEFEGHYMVMKKNGGTKPWYRHKRLAKAVLEAERLASINNGTYLILQIVGRSKPKDQ